jgi:DNA repair protein RecN (Recombination protein N)
VRIADRPATLQALRQLGALLLEIHGQGDARMLVRAESQAETLDAFAGTADLRERFAAALHEARAARARWQQAGAGERERQRRIEFLRYQQQVMAAVDLRDGEVAALEDEHRLLAHLDRMRELLALALAALQDGETNAGDLLARAGRALDEAGAIDRGLQGAAERLGEAAAAVRDVAREVQSRGARLELDPGRLRAVEDRLAALRDALARFGPGEAQFAANLADCRRELAALTAEDAHPAALERSAMAALAAAHALAERLARARQRAAPALCAKVEGELAALGMRQARFRVAAHELPDAPALLDAASAHGPVPVEFEVAVNPGEPFVSLAKTASGGEIARIVLALKKCLADHDRVPFLVFDEIDAEIGGRLGLALGAKLREVADSHQLLIVTHLPQIAAFAAAHWKVQKTSGGGRTRTTIERLDGAAVERELAAMAVGEGADAEAVAEARRLVRRARRDLD